MEYAVLGRTGLRVSRVGCGGGGIGQVWGPTTETESVRAIHRALELGVNFLARFVTRDSGVSVMYAEELNSAKSSATLQRTDRHGILGQKPAHLQVSL